MDHFQQAQRIIDEILDSWFQRLESCHDSTQAIAIEANIDDLIKQLEHHLDRADITVNKATSGPHRSAMKLKLDQLKYDHKHLLSSFRAVHQRRLHREREKQQREELLTRRFTTNAEASRSSDALLLDIGGAGDYRMDQERTKLRGFNRSVDDMMQTGTAVLASLRDQRTRLSQTRHNLMETINSLGLSNTVMRLIEKRHIGDKFVLFGGMTLVTTLMFVVWFWWL